MAGAKRSNVISEDDDIVGVGVATNDNVAEPGTTDEAEVSSSSDPAMTTDAAAPAASRHDQGGSGFDPRQRRDSTSSSGAQSRGAYRVYPRGIRGSEQEVEQLAPATFVSSNTNSTAAFPNEDLDRARNASAESMSGTYTTDAQTTDAVVERAEEVLVSQNEELFQVTATIVDDDCIVDASPVEESSTRVIEDREQDERKIKDLKKRHRYGIISVAILAVVAIVATVLGVLSPQPKATDSGRSDEGNANTSSSDSQVDSQRYDALLNIVAPLSGGKEMFDSNGPSASTDRIAALKWLVSDTSQTSLADPSMEWKIRQRYILALFYFSTNGPQWYEQYNFLSTRDECEWISAWSDGNFLTEDLGDSRVELKGVLCDPQGRLERLVLYWNNLSGTLPHELSHFGESLKHLNMPGGSISSTIPESYASFKNLEMVIMAENCLTGTVPVDIQRLENLEVFTIHGNDGLTGSLNELCGGPSVMSAGCGTCDGSVASIQCDCCVCCESTSFQCCDDKGDVLWNYYNLEPNPMGVPFSFDRDCRSGESRRWQAEECPCTLESSEVFASSFICSTDCGV